MLNLTINRVAKQLRSSSLSASELCDACLTRVEKTKKLNAFVCVLGDRARQEACESDERIKRGFSKGVLDGIPVAVKDNFCTSATLTTCGSNMLSNFHPPYDATVVTRLSNSGAVLIGKCNLDEFAMGSGTVDSIHGPTQNIWRSGIPHELYYDKKKSKERTVRTCGNSEEKDWYIAGGSSGGSAVAVATGSCFAALGSDTGGSTRNPAAYCGVVGLKPTYGLVSRHGLIPLVNSMDVPGIICRSVEDITLILNAVAGPDPLDSTTVKRDFQKIDLSKNKSVSGLRVGIPNEYHCPGMTSEVLDIWRHAACLLEECGATIVNVSLPHTPSSIACYSVLNQCEVASNMARYDGLRFGIRASESKSTEQLYAETRSKGFNEVVRSRILAGNYFLLKQNYDRYFTKALKVRRLIKEDFDRVWNSDVDLLLTPTTLTHAPRLSHFKSHDNQTQCVTQDYCTQPANMAGIPAISLPVGLSKEGLPLSLQIMAPMFKENVLLKTALSLQQVVEFPRLRVIE